MCFDTLVLPLIDGNYIAYDKDEAVNPENSSSTDKAMLRLQNTSYHSMTFGATRTTSVRSLRL